MKLEIRIGTSSKDEFGQNRLACWNDHQNCAIEVHPLI